MNKQLVLIGLPISSKSTEVNDKFYLYFIR